MSAEPAVAPALAPRPAARIERHSVDYVAESDRHGRAIDQAPFWFLGNFHFFTIAIGFVGPGMGLSFGYTALAAPLGILFGTLFVAFHASQGPELGLPQMIQSRAQFGFRGVVVVLIGTLFTFVGFNVANCVLTANGLHGILGWNGTIVTLVITAVAALLAIYGYDWLHRIFRWCFFVSLPLYAWLTVAIIAGKVPTTHTTVGTFSLVAFVSQFAASASYNITYAPSVSDYSRYLPRATPARSIIASVYVGASSSAIWLIAVGAWLATHLGASDGLVALFEAGKSISPTFAILLSLASVAALVAAMGLNAYSGMLTVLTALNSLFETQPSPRLRVLVTVALAATWAGFSFALNADSIALLFAVLTMMLYLLAPWTSINLIDYFFVRRGRYAITEFFRPHGLYGAWGARGLIAYSVGFAATLPFCVLPDLYVGPLARVLGGIDLGWLVGLLVSGAVYWLLARGLRDMARAASFALIFLWLAHTSGVTAATPVAPGIQLIPGAARADSQPDGNSILIEAPAGLIVFDTGRHVEHTRQVLDFAAAAHRPIVAIINSHWHLDHTGGNVLLREKYPDVHVYASSAIQRALGGFLADYRQQLASALDHTPPDSPTIESMRSEIALIDAGPRLLPTDVIDGSSVRVIAGRELEVHLEHGAATAGDVWVFDPKTRVLLAGDLVTLPAPFLDTACPTRWRDSLTHLAAKRFDVLIPGHGAAMSAAQLRTYSRAFTRLLSCGSSDRPKDACIDGWLGDSGALIPQADRGYTRSLLDYYLDNILRGSPQRLAKLCAA